MLNTMVSPKEFSHSRHRQVPRASTAAQLKLRTSSIAYTIVSDAGCLAPMATAESEIMKTMYVSGIAYPILG